jgi:crotonobetainyl-CoA:carnitine CoA-transferase CaiB-like acyl-CoA transferase
MSITGPIEGPPFKTGVAISDLAAGLQAAVAILAALRHRDATGAGQFIDVSLFDSSLSLLANVASSTLMSGQPPTRWGNAHPSIVPYETVVASDGPLMLAVGNDAQFLALCQVLGEPAWAGDPRFATNPQRVRHRDALMPMIARRFVLRSTREWLAALEAKGIPAGPVRTVPEALSSPEAAERGMVVALTGPGGSPVRVVGPVPKLSGTPAQPRPAPSRLGEHTEEVLRAWLGYDETRVARLRANGAIV